ncbi:U1 small nuclear ribonucleoprotein 70 kDa-like [Mizuhopecten yessoensis]|uniref:U1 small nuclear ribonucleoprotein 70 kDa n=1 Tax=Mizuhopecten yessoensis TaxID=6573 RepID=A0A210QPF9_MIZYE|nr:U1 small nuclear ribonucleoprotein 70 kDa-like [Mizuhopecten yessoensis]OWF50588.1 U1 small nuclear ribonucleoprotein 70 kDa [Mizuhopecten yessoensis]
MTAFLPPNLLALFAARDPITYLPPADKQSHEKKRVPYGGVAVFLNEFEDPKDTPPPTRVETKDERKERKRKERAEQIAYKLEQDLALWDPSNNPGSTGDPYKSLFVARINFDTSESKLRREFEVYGPIRKICMLTDKVSGKPRGYAFIEYEHERDMHSAYKHADGKKIDGRRVLVDVERGRTVKGWQPRRLGGGLGGTRKGGPDENTRFSGRDEYREDGSRERGGGGSGGGGGGSVGGGGGGGDRRGGRPRSRSRERRPRSRSREREAPRRRSRSREHNRRGGIDEDEDRSRKRGRRSRSRERKRTRSRDRGDRKRARRSRSRDRGDRRRDRPEGQPDEVMQDMPLDFDGKILIKQEDQNKGYPDEEPNGFPRETRETREDASPQSPPQEEGPREEQQEYQQ